MSNVRSATIPASTPRTNEFRFRPVVGESSLTRSFQMALMVILTAQQDLGGEVVTAEMLEKLNDLFRSTHPQGACVEWSGCTFRTTVRPYMFQVELKLPHSALEARLASLAEKLSDFYYERFIVSGTFPSMVIRYDTDQRFFHMGVLPTGN